MVLFPGAKINIGLYVTNKRTDGYHDIETLFYPIGFSDILEAIADPAMAPGNIRISLSGVPVEGPAEQNLVVKAYSLLHRRFGLPGVSAALHKRIPTGTGLGGGSADGAAMLRLLNDLFRLGLSEAELLPIAAELGSDCPFFIKSEPSFAYGRGEILVPAGISLKGLTLMLFHPGKGISTQEAYRHVQVSAPVQTLTDGLTGRIEDWSRTTVNVFERYAIEQQPVVGLIKEELYGCGAVYASMTGSGAAVYGLFKKEADIPSGISAFFIWKERL